MENVSRPRPEFVQDIIQVHGASVHGSIFFRREISSKRLLDFLSKIDPCIVATEACAGSHHWGGIAELGHQVKLIAPIYVKPFVKRQKNDAADSEAICEAAMRPTMRAYFDESGQRFRQVADSGLDRVPLGVSCRCSCPHRGHADDKAGASASFELDVTDRQRSSSLTCGLHRMPTLMLTLTPEQRGLLFEWRSCRVENGDGARRTRRS